MVKKLLPLLCDCQTYVEPFGGGASLLFAKPPSPVEVYNDLNSGLVNLFRVLRDEEKFAEFQRLVKLTPYAREEYNFCRENWQKQENDMERAYQFFVVARMSFGGHNSFGHNISSSNRGMPQTVSKWLGAVDGLSAVHDRLMRVQIENQDWRIILERYDTPNTLFYCDPPYIHSTRKAGKYEHEMTDDEHRDLVRALLSVEGRVMLSCYDHPIYEMLDLAGWDKRLFSVSCSAAARTRQTGILGDGAATEKQTRIEAVYRNYEIQLRLL